MTEYQKAFIANMKFYRNQASLSQAELAEKCNVSNGTIGNIECGITKPSFDLIFIIATALNISAEALFRNTEDKSNNEIRFTKKQILKIKESVNNVVITAINTAVENLEYNIEN